MLLCLALAVPAKAVAQQPADQKPPDQTPPPDQPTEAPKYEDQVIVTASRVEQKLVNAPATVSLISAQTIASAPSASYAELLRGVPGMNVTQTSARDINLVSRSATGTLSTSQLALIDGRSIYQDFFGFVAWDFLPVNTSEIKQIEVIRGPASAVWGANALTGVVNVITKSPRELVGQSLLVSVGTFGRDASGVERSNGSMFSVSGSHAAAPSDTLAYKITAGFSTQDALGRPSGLIPNGTNTPYPDYENTGTSQPKFDVRVDYDFPDKVNKLIFAGGFAGTEGMIHTGIGPFDIDRGTFLGYGKVNYSHGGTHVNAFVNHLDGDATNRLSRDITGTFIPFSFKNTTFDVEASDLRSWRGKHVFSYGGNVRYNTFDLSLAPLGDSRTEAGVYGQDEWFISDHFRAVIGARVDKFSSIDGAVFSPRTTLLVKPDARSSIRLSFNQAFRAPSFINNHLQANLLAEVNLSPISPILARFIFPFAAVGNPDLKQESLTAYELGYTGVLNKRATVTASVYWNTTKDAIFFTPVTFYGPANPPPTWPAFIPPFVLGLLPAPLPSSYTYRNLGEVKDKGFELGVEAAATRDINVFVNYSYQADPVIVGFDPREANSPANNRFNAGFNMSHGRFLGNLDVSYSGSAYWQDVLDLRYAGTTDAYTLVNGAFGVRWAGEKVVTSLKITNIGNAEVQQHIFGDVLRRQVVGEVRFGF